MKYNDQHGKILKECGFIPWQPSTWPEPATAYNEKFKKDLGAIIKISIIGEIENVMQDAIDAQGSFEHRGHVIALSMLCSIDAISAYAYKDISQEACEMCGKGDSVAPGFKKYIQSFFPENYKKYSNQIYKFYRCAVVHEWNLSEVAILPGPETITDVGGSISFGLQDFFKALNGSVDNFLKELETDGGIQTSSIKRYSDIRNKAISTTGGVEQLIVKLFKAIKNSSGPSGAPITDNDIKAIGLSGSCSDSEHNMY
jgi:hypothetical protein